MDWNRCKREFREFFDAVEDVRFRLGCEGKNAWFRGVKSTAYCLTPSLFRRPLPLNAVWQLSHECNSASWRGKRLPSALAAFRRAWRKIPTNVLPQSSGCEQLLRIRKGRGPKKDVNRSLAKRVRNALSLALTEVEDQRVPHERDLFTEFSYRDGGSFRSSWHALAAAQHYQAGTRMLDWSDSLLVALAFAVQDYLSKIASHDLLRRGELAPDLERLVSKVDEPALWVLNPYHLAASSGETSILDPTWDKRRDYYDMFLLDRVSWPLAKPLPLTISWETPRIAAQRGSFTIHGRCPLPLEEQVGSSVVAKCKLSKPAALYATYLVRDVCAFDSYTLNRDRHHLGTSIRRRHLGY